MQLNLPITPVTDLLIYRDDLIVATQGRGFYILENLAVPRSFRPDPAPAAIFFKPEDAYRSGGQFPVPTFCYWFRETPTAPVTVEVTDALKQVVLNLTAQPGSESAQPAAAQAGGGRGGRAGGGAGGGAAGGGGGGEDPEAGGGQRGRGAVPTGPGGSA